ncbi:hypothetical protein DFP97_10755 [Paenibacillus prosopidis]|uniref:Uncharacterized protein n=1 Tax=Paenibacillus prosopidis TaxID=630520 RepID=A0A368W4R8_9BACL|nr:hypothetical protein DFP97_10755 [Paenibacillus prosopidis]
MGITSIKAIHLAPDYIPFMKKATAQVLIAWAVAFSLMRLIVKLVMQEA